MKKKLSAREKYAAIRETQTAADLAKPVPKDEPLFNFTAPSGMEFKLRRPNLNTFVNMGTLPTSLAAKVNQGDMASAEESFKALPAAKQVKLITQAANLVRYICVDPRIVDEPQADNEIAPEDVTLDDFNALVKWASGGVEAERLGNFR